MPTITKNQAPASFVSDEEIYTFVNHLKSLHDDLQPTVVDRRSVSRCDINVVVDLIRLNEELTPTGEPFQAMSKNISNTGIGLLMTERLDCELVLIRIHAPDRSTLTIKGRVIYTKKYGPYDGVGLQFITG
ncbi:MAG: hypothetical protein ACI87E_005280 [Mariniblastus sp.]|jgi:hypothetical protein